MVTEYTRFEPGTQPADVRTSIRRAWFDPPGPNDIERLGPGVERAAQPATTLPSSSGPTLGEAIQTRRVALGLTQADLAARVNDLGGAIRQSDVSRLERCKVALPHSLRLHQIAGALDLPTGQLLALGGWQGAETVFDASRLAVSASPSEPNPTPAMGTPALPSRDLPTAEEIEDIVRRCREESYRVRRIVASVAKDRRFMR